MMHKFPKTGSLLISIAAAAPVLNIATRFCTIDIKTRFINAAKHIIAVKTKMKTLSDSNAAPIIPPVAADNSNCLTVDN